MKPSSPHTMKSAQQGSMMLEALIAVTIFSIGILGSIGLQAAVINNTLDARYRTDATFLANQIISQMWVDPTKVIDPVYLTESLVINASYACTPCTGANGNANTQAWVAEIQGGFLPAGPLGTENQPSISISGNQVTVTVNWMSPQGGAHQYSTTTEIQFN